MPKNTNTASDSRYTKVIRLRVSESEYELLSKEASSVGYTISQAARNLMFDRRVSSQKQSPAHAKEEGSARVADLVGKCVADIKRIADTYTSSLSLTNRAGDPVLNDMLTRRYLLSVEKRLGEIVSAVSGNIRIVNIEEGETAGEKEGFPSFWVYLTGTVCSEMKEKHDGGVPKTAFLMTSYEISQGKKWCYTVNVETAYDAALMGIRKGMAVSMWGNLHIELSTLSVLPKLDLFIYTDKVSIVNK